MALTLAAFKSQLSQTLKLKSVFYAFPLPSPPPTPHPNPTSLLEVLSLQSVQFGHSSEEEEH